LINTPSLLLADEPTGNLDSASGAGIMALFKEINAEGRTIVLVTHDPVVARQASRVLTMRDGQLVTEARV
jgi:putative ABC transport system ATP-binding protein